MPDDLHAIKSSDLYDVDFYVWTEAQSALILRNRAALEAMGIDVDHLAEEVAELGTSERNRVLGLVRQIIVHLYKLASSRAAAPRGGWKAEIAAARADIETVITPTIRRFVENDLDKLHARAARVAQLSFETHEPETPVDTSLQWTLAEILGEASDPLDADETGC